MLRQLLSRHKRQSERGFTLAEVLMALAITALFGAAVFATNSRLLLMLKGQREETAASMMLQEHVEAFRSLTYSQIATNTVSATPSPSPASAADIVYNGTQSESQLGGINGSLSETVTVSGYMDASGTTPASPNKNVWVRNSAHPTGSLTTSNSTLATDYDLIQVDIQLSWNSADGRLRKREITELFGRGNIGN